LAAAAVLPTEMVAAFGFYRNLADQLGRLLPFNMFRSLLEPVLIGRYLASNDLSALAQSRRLLLKLNLMAGLPLVAIVFTVADPLMAVVTDGRYVAELWMLPLLLLGAVANAQKTLSVVSANATDLSAWLTPAALAGSASVLALWLAHGVLGPVVLCVSDLVFCAVFSATVAWVLARYRGSVSGWHLGGLAKMSLALLLALVMGWMLNRSVELERSWASAAASLFVGLGFFTAAFILKPFSDRERASLNSIYPRLKWPF
jgi:O-antigen/teichoic acid export membrane protein